MIFAGEVAADDICRKWFHVRWLLISSTANKHKDIVEQCEACIEQRLEQ